MNKIRKNITDNIELYLAALYLGLTGYGGQAVINQIKKIYVDEKKIVTEKKFLQSLSLAQILPGSNIIGLIAFFNYLRAGLIGAVIGTGIYILPTFLIITSFAHIYFKYSHILEVDKIIKGLNILLISLLFNALIGLGRIVYTRHGKIDYRSVLITITCFISFYAFNLGVISTIIISGLLGVLFYTLTGFYNKSPQIIHDTHKKLFNHKKAWIAMLIMIVFLALSIFYLSDPLWFLFSAFFRIGLFAFGGGVAAIPLIRNVFVNQTQIFTLSQFWDGIAISQVTSGPILIASAFFGYKVAGFLGALVSTIAMCIPSVLLIILVGKIHDRIKNLTLVRGVIRGFLSGFIGILAVLIFNQGFRFLHNWQNLTFAALMLLILFKAHHGVLISLLATFVYSLLFL